MRFTDSSGFRPFRDGQVSLSSPFFSFDLSEPPGSRSRVSRSSVGWGRASGLVTLFPRPRYPTLPSLRLPSGVVVGLGPTGGVRGPSTERRPSLDKVTPFIRCTPGLQVTGASPVVTGDRGPGGGRGERGGYLCVWDVGGRVPTRDELSPFKSFGPSLRSQD